jgi:hypothetical protein
MFLVPCHIGPCCYCHHHTSTKMEGDENDKGPLILAVCIPFISMGLLFVAARVWVRATEAKRFWTDDYIIAIAAVSACLSSNVIPTC